MPPPTPSTEEATLRFGQALKVITDLQDRGVIPPASIIGRSGTGAWLFWLLQDEKDPSRPPGAYPEKQLEYLTIQKGLGHRIRDAAPALRPDALAIDVSRVTRVPGSMHSGAHRRVSYVAQFDDTVPSEFDYSDGMVWLRAPLFSYTLRELRDWLGVEKRPEPKMVKARSTGKTPKRRAGWVALTQQRLAEYQRVEAHRDGFQQGHRHMALFAGALFMRTLNWDEDQVEDEVEKLARRCSPPLTRTEWKDALRDGLAARGKRRWVRDETLVGWLQTTAEETETLDLHHLRHDAEYKGPYVPRTGRRLNREARPGGPGGAPHQDRERRANRAGSTRAPPHQVRHHRLRGHRPQGCPGHWLRLHPRETWTHRSRAAAALLKQQPQRRGC